MTAVTDRVPTETYTCPFSQQQLERVFSLLVDNRPLQICEVFSGNINTIVKVASGGRCYGLRVRTQEGVYRYEPDLVKEAFIVWLLNHARGTISDKDVASAFAQILRNRRGSITGSSRLLPSVLRYDWSRQVLPYPYCIYEWEEGEPLWNVSEPQLYRLAGQTLTQIHQIQFSAFYADFLSVGIQPISWEARYLAALDKELATARGSLDLLSANILKAMTVSASISCAPCLVHNDFSPGNILVRDETIAAVIDWDNAVIDVPHLDFVKMKYWTAKNARGELAHAPTLFSAFVDGYGPAGREIVASSLFCLYEALWLLRVFNFERAKEEQGLPRAPGYPAASIYRKHLKEVLNKL